MVDTDRVDDTRLFGLDALETTNPFAAVAEGADTLDRVRACECSRDEIPDGVGWPGILVRWEPVETTGQRTDRQWNYYRRTS